MNLVLLHPAELDERGEACLSDARARHILEVLKKKPGEGLRIGKLDGPMGSAAVMRVEPPAVYLSCEWTGDVPERPRIDLLLALPRPKVMKRLWAQLAALGVGRIVLTNAWKVERFYFDSHVLDPDFYTPLLIEGLMQARDTLVPEVRVHRAFRPLIEDELGALFPSGARILLDPAAGVPFAEATTQRAGRLLLAVGPEGGWTPFEIELMREHGFQPASMPLRTVRTDTACIAALALAHAVLKR